MMTITSIQSSCKSNPELIDAWRAVANAKLAEYRKQCWRLAGLVRCGTLDKQSTVDKLWEIATAHALVRSLGEDRVQSIINEAFSGSDFPAAMYAAEVA
jgi:hypothetical protein